MISKYFTNIRTPSIRKGKAGHNLISKVWKNRFGKSSGPLHLERIVSRPHLGTNTLCCTSFPSSGPCRDTCVVPLCIHVVWTGSPIHSWRNGTSNWLWRSWLRCGDEQLTPAHPRGESDIGCLGPETEPLAPWACSGTDWNVHREKQILIINGHWAASFPGLGSKHWKHSSTSDVLNVTKHNLGCLTPKGSEDGSQHRTGIEQSSW